MHVVRAVTTWPDITPRRWQAEALPLVLDSLTQGGGGVVSAFMGSGKSILQAEVVAQRMAYGSVLVTAPLRKLVEQLGETIAKRVGAENVGRYFTDEKQPAKPVVIACHASLTALADEGVKFGTWIADECHKTEADSITAFAERVEFGAIAGFSATPFRAEAWRRLSLFDRLIVEYSGRDAVADGVCVRPRVVLPDGVADTTELLDSASVRMIQNHAALGPGVCSAYTIDDAKEFAGRLTDAGIKAEPVHSRQRKKAQSDLIAQLESGSIDALVYPSLLSEGIDMPWLRWMCLRRAVSSRVRFLQETGRVLRSHPGKTEGVILDPHDLFGSFALTYDAMLGEPDEQPAAKEEEQAEESAAEDSTEAEKAARRVRLVRGTERFLRSTSLALYYAGLVDQKAKRWSTAKDESSPKQVALIERLAPVLRHCDIPADTVERMRTAYRMRASLSKRGASDMIDAMMATTKRGHWPIEVT